LPTSKASGSGRRQTWGPGYDEQTQPVAVPRYSPADASSRIALCVEGKPTAHSDRSDASIETARQEHCIVRRTQRCLRHAEACCSKRATRVGGLCELPDAPSSHASPVRGHLAGRRAIVRPVRMQRSCAARQHAHPKRRWGARASARVGQPVHLAPDRPLEFSLASFPLSPG